jgi:hypothetical protein
MSNSTILGKIVKDLEGAKKILDGLKGTISRLRAGLDPIERTLRVRDLSKASSVIAGMPGVYVIMPTALCTDDPLGATLESMTMDQKDNPNLIKLEDSSESEETCRALNRIIEAEQLRFESEGFRGPRALVVLRWSNMSEQFNKSPIAVVGKRYRIATGKQVIEFEKTLEKCGIKVYQDVGEFGGGPITYHLSRYFSDQKNMFVIQITISRTLAEDGNQIQKILKCLSTI